MQHYCILPILLTRHTRSNPLMLVSSVLYNTNNTVGKLLEAFLLTAFHGINWVPFFPIYKEAQAKAYTIEIIKAAFRVTEIFFLNPRVVLSLSTDAENPGLIPPVYLNTLTPCMTFGSKLSSLTNITPLLKPRLLVQSCRGCIIRTKISVLQRRTCDSLVTRLLATLVIHFLFHARILALPSCV